MLFLSIDCAAIIEAEGIIDKGTGERRDWTHIAQGDSRSDVLTNLEAFRSASEFTFDKFGDYGIDKVNYTRAERIRTMLRERMDLASEPISSKLCKPKQREHLLTCLWHGMMNCVYRHVGNGQYKSVLRDEPVRVLSSDSNIDSSNVNHPFIVATPLTIGRIGKDPIRLAKMASFVDPDWLQKNVISGFKKAIKQAIKDSNKLENFGKERDRAETYHRESKSRRASKGRDS